MLPGCVRVAPGSIRWPLALRSEAHQAGGPRDVPGTLLEEVDLKGRQVAVAVLRKLAGGEDGLPRACVPVAH